MLENNNNNNHNNNNNNNSNNDGSAADDEDDDTNDLESLRSSNDDDDDEDDLIPNMSESEDSTDLDPELQAALDKEVEEFRQRLESINSQTRTNPKIPLPVPAAAFVSSLVGVH